MLGRFSLKAIFIVIAYVAIAVLALTRQKLAWTNALWLLTLGLCLYAITVAIMGIGRRRAAALGFVIWAAAYGALLWWNPERAISTGVALEYAKPLTESQEEALEQEAREWEEKRKVFGEDYRTQEFESFQSAVEAAKAEECIVVAAHAIALAIVGAIGSLVGSHAYGDRERKSTKDDA